MSNLRVAGRYAEALMEEAEQLHLLEDVGKDLVSIKKLIKESPEFRQLIKSPVIKKEKKHQTFEIVLSKSINPLTLRFLLLLVEKEREPILSDIIVSFFKLQREVMGIIDVEVKTATELSDDQLERMKERFETYSKKNIQFNVSLDPRLIGGFIARIGDTVFDGSVKRQLELLHQRFIQEPSVP